MRLSSIIVNEPSTRVGRGIFPNDWLDHEALPHRWLKAPDFCTICSVRITIKFCSAAPSHTEHGKMDWLIRSQMRATVEKNIRFMHIPKFVLTKLTGLHSRACRDAFRCAWSAHSYSIRTLRAVNTVGILHLSLVKMIVSCCVGWCS